jgi:hypothetical protein
VLRGREDGQLSVPFRPFADALSDYLAARGPAVVDEIGEAADDLARLRGAAPAVATAQPLGGTAHWRMLAAIRAWLVAATRSEPIALVIEDLQWATSTIVTMLRHLLGDDHGPRLLMIATCRVGQAGSPELASALADLLASQNVSRIAPPPLTGQEVGELLDAAAGRDLPQLATAIAVRTGGNPLYISETIRHLITRANGPDDIDGGPLDLPAALGELVQLRLRSLGPSSRTVLELAALAGARVDVDVLAAAHGEAGATRAALERGAALGLISLDEDTVSFRHDVLREAVEAGMDEARRPRLHRALALALDARDRDDELPSRAHHWGCAAALGDSEAEQAIRAHRAAARQAGERLAFGRAVEHLSAARAVLLAHDPAEARLLEQGALAIELGAAMRDAGNADYPAVLQLARQFAYRLDDPVRLAQATLAGTRGGVTQTAMVDDAAIMTALTDALRDLPQTEPQLRTRVKAALALESRWSHAAQATVLAEEAVTEARRTGEPRTIAVTLVSRQTLGRLQPDTELADADELRGIAIRARDPAISCEAAVIAFDARLRRAELAHADAEMATLERIAERSALPYFRWVALTRRAGWHVLLGNDEAEAVIEKAAAVGTEIGIHPTLTYSSRSGQLFVGQMAEGRAVDAVTALAAVEPFAGRDVSWQASMAAAAAENGDLPTAARLFDGIVTHRLGEIVDDQLGLLTTMCLAWAAARLADPRAELLAPKLSGRAGQLSWIASFSLGPVDLALAWTAIACGDANAAHGRLDSALALAQRAQARPWIQLIERQRDIANG